jgi:monomeric sarcosine oxidase
MIHQQHCVIIGAGITGLSTAYALLGKGKGRQRVTVLEEASVDHERSASHGYSRLLRFEYGPDAHYTNMVRLSLERWRKLERCVGRELYTRTGVLTLGKRGDHWARASFPMMRSLGLPVEQLREDECQRRFPQFAVPAFETFVYNAEGGILHASTCLRTLCDCVGALGGEIRENCRVTRLEYERTSRPVLLHLASGEILDADRVVIAAGPRVHDLLADLRLPVRVTRQYLLYFAGLSPTAFGAGRFPAFLADNLYGFPIHQGCNGWVKAASHEPGAPADAAPPDQAILALIRRQLYELLPALRSAALARVDSCTYDMSPDGDFILDRLPHDHRVIVATGLSGHGFKFGLLLGEVLSSMVCEEEPVIRVERFSLKRFTTIPQSMRSAASYAYLPGVSR